MTSSDRYTDGRYLAANPTWGEEEAPWKADLVLQMLERHGLEPSSVCEFGSGSGRLLQDLYSRVPRAQTYVGYDISPSAHALAATKQVSGLRFKLGDIADMPSSEQYELGLAIDVFEHIEDYFSFLRRLREHSTHQVFHIPLDVSVQTVARARPFAYRRSTVGHIHFFTKETAFAVLRDCGYTVIDSFYTCKSMNLTTKAKVARLLRRIPFSVDEDLTVRWLGGYSLLVLTS